MPHFFVKEVEDGTHEDANTKGCSQALIGMEGEADQQGEEEGPFLVFWLDSQADPQEIDFFIETIEERIKNQRQIQIGKDTKKARNSRGSKLVGQEMEDVHGQGSQEKDADGL